MKTLTKTTTLIAALLLLTAAQCEKDIPPIDQLPPATQTGENTFGCLVNGEAFKPKGNPLGGPILQAYYQFVDGGYWFGLTVKNNEKDILRGLAIHTTKREIHEGETLILEIQAEGNASAHFSLGGGGVKYVTTETITGELTITRFDQINNIVSGTFWFDAINEAGEIVQVREGRFDMQFSL